MQIIYNNLYKTEETRIVIIEICEKKVSYLVIITTDSGGLKYIEYHKCIPERLTTSEKKQVKRLIHEYFEKP